jgi:hypothetical protein
METALAPIAQTSKPQIARPGLAKPLPKAAPVESQIKLATVQKASGNLAIQRVADSGEVESPVAIQKAPATPQEDPGYQAVVKKLRVTAKHESTTPKKPKEKGEEVKEAAELPDDDRKKEVTDDLHLNTMDKVQPPKIEDFTVAGFTEKFRAKVDEIATKLPKQKSEQNAVARVVAFSIERAETIQDVKNQNQALAKPLREAVDHPPVLKEKLPPTPQLKVDPAGDTPEIKNAGAAAVKPRTKDEISMDNESRALDDSLKNHSVGGQQVDIKEDSLPYSVSGEKDFDEAGEAKRKAQEEIRKIFPRYREQEKGVISKSEAEIPAIVKSGLKDQHGKRSVKFDEVLGTQKGHEGTIEDKKKAVFKQFQTFYEDAKRDVGLELAKISNIETEFEAVLNKAEQDFKDWVHNDLEYIYTPGFFDYSNWKDLNEKEINEEHQRLRKEKGSENKFVGGFDYLRLEAMNIVRDRHAKILFERAKDRFVYSVNYGVEKIGEKVVEALNNANKLIRTAITQTMGIYAGLDDNQKEEMDTAIKGIMVQYETLAESVKDREREIIEDMARNYSRSIGKLQATFDAIKKDVLTSWLEKAWNKLKAIVNAIIEFATRIVALLARMVGLVGDIISSPRAFFRNLITGISEGFSTFVERIDEYLATAFFDWIRGTSGVQVQLPKEWNAAGIFSLFTQLLNLSTETIWQRMEVVYDKTVANAFRRGEVLLDKGLEIFDIVKREGLGGLWDHIVESLGTLLSSTLDEMKETVLYAAIKKVFIEIGKMLVPGGGFIAIAEKIIRLVVFIVEARNKILDLIESFVASMENAVKGDIAGIVTKITEALTKFITVALDFLVTFFGLGNLKEKVERFIERMRKPIIRGIDWVLEKFKPLVMKGKELVAKGTEKVVGAGRKVVAKVANWLGIRKRFTSEGETHTLFFRGAEASAQLWVATEEMPFATLLKKKEVEINEITNTTKASKQAALKIASNIYNNDIVRLKSALAATADEASKNQLQSDLNDKFNDIVPHLVVIGVGSGGRLPKTNVTVGSPRGRADWVEADPVTKYESKKHDRVTVEPLGWASHIKTIANFDDIYVRLHLLHFDLGGPGNDTGNVTPGRKSENINMYNQTEQHAVDLVHEKSKVLWYRANVTGYRSEQGYTDFAEGIRVRYGFKERKEDGEWAKVGDVLYDSVFPVTKPDPKGTNDPVPTINTLSFDYWDDELKKIPNRPTRDVYRDLIKAKNKAGGYGDWAVFIGSKEFQVANVEYGGNLEDWFKGAIALGKIRSI